MEEILHLRGKPQIRSLMEKRAMERDLDTLSTVLVAVLSEKLSVTRSGLLERWWVLQLLFRNLYNLSPVMEWARLEVKFDEMSGK